MIRRSLVLLLGLCLACAGAPGARLEIEKPEAATPWTHLDVADEAGDFRFAIVSDRTGGHREGVFARAIEVVQLIHPAFVVSVGDLIEGEVTDPGEIDAMWAEFDALVAPLAAPFFYVPGNHDYSNPTMAREWTRRFGPSFYRFEYRDVLFLVLNSELFSGYYTPGEPVEGGATAEDQWRFLEETLSPGSDARWTFVLMHQPVWALPQTEDDWARVEALLGDRPYTVIAGHFHAYQKMVRNDREHLILGTSGGGSRLRGLERGEFDHVTLVTMTDAGPKIANLLLDGVHDSDVHDQKDRNLIAALDNAIAIEPMRVEGEIVGEAEQRFVLKNTSDRTITVRGRVEASPHFALTPAAIERELPRRSEETVTLALRPKRSTPLSRVTPAIVRWTAEAQGRHGPVSMDHLSYVAPDTLFGVPRATGPVAVDGDLGDWPPLRFAVDDWPEDSGARADSSLRFDLRTDASFLHLAIDVRDATPVSDAAAGVLAQDGVTLQLDARPDPARSRNARVRPALADGTIARSLALTLAPVDGQADTVLHRRGAKPPEGLRRAVKARDAGYTAELAIPHAFLDEAAGRTWTHVRLNLTLHDAEQSGGVVHELSWRPVRYAPLSEAVEGAGTFVRED